MVTVTSRQPSESKRDPFHGTYQEQQQLGNLRRKEHNNSSTTSSGRRKQYCFRSRRMIPSTLMWMSFAICLIMALLPWPCAAEESITWTPNEEETSQSLPMSMKQRQQLLQLQQAIQQSPNPEATLNQVAQSNGISPHELVNVLNKNAQDLQQNPDLLQQLQQQGGGGGGMTLPSPTKIIGNALAAMYMILSQMAKKHPQSFTLAVTSIVLVAFLFIEVPRTGLVLSSKQSLLRLSTGPTTWNQPPTRYVSKLVSVSRIEQQRPQLFSKLSVQTPKTHWDDLDIATASFMNVERTYSKDDGPLETLGPIMVYEHNIKQLQKQQQQRKRRGTQADTLQLAQAVTAQVSLSPKALAQQFYVGGGGGGSVAKGKTKSKQDGPEEEKEGDFEDNSYTPPPPPPLPPPTREELSDIVSLFLEHANALLSTRQLTEFVGGGLATKILKDYKEPIPILSRLSFVSSPSSSDGLPPKHGILVVPGLGDWGRYGLVYVKVTQQEQEYGSMSAMTLTTLKGLGHFDGQIHISIERQQDNIRSGARDKGNVDDQVDGNGGDDDDDDDRVLVTIHLVVPKGKRKLKRKLAQQVLKTLCHSLATSIQRRTEQTLTRQTQSSRFKSKASSKATQRRHLRFEKEREIEEMAVERRRRWQRSNPDAGRYRPSGDRQRSPNNC